MNCTRSTNGLPLYLLRANPSNDGNLEIEEWDGEDWNDSTEFPVPVDGYFETNSKPGFVWHPYNMPDDWQDPAAGYWMIAHQRRNHSSSATGLFYLDGPGPSSTEFGHIRGRFFHSWNFSRPVDFLYYPGDQNIHAITHRNGEINGTTQDYIEFYPYADGIFPATLTDHDDFSVIVEGICGGFLNSEHCPYANPTNRECGPSGALQPSYNEGEYR